MMQPRADRLDRAALVLDCNGLVTLAGRALCRQRADPLGLALLAIQTHQQRRADVGIGGGAGQRPLGQPGVIAELRRAVGMGERNHPRNEACNALGNGTGIPIRRNGEHVITDTHLPVGAPIAQKRPHLPTLPCSH